MLREDVVAAVKSGEFHVYAVETVDQAIALLTGVAAGEADERGKYPDETVNGAVAARLWKMFRLRQSYSSETKTGQDGTNTSDQTIA
jgi:hypothetical protein